MCQSGSRPAQVQREYSYLALSEHGLDVRPCLALCSVAEQVHDDGTLLNRSVHVEQVGSWNPAILYSLFPAGTIFANTNDHVQTVVAEVQALAVTLRAVADQREGVVLEVVQELVTRPVTALYRSLY